MVAKYTSIPEPTADPISLRDSIVALKQTVETLTGQRGSGESAALLPESLGAVQSSQADLETTVAGLQTAITAIEGKLAAYETAWADYVPTLTPGSGSFSSVTATGAYKVLGKTVSIAIAITFSTNGSASGSVSASLPLPAATEGGALAGSSATGIGMVGLIGNGATTAVIRNVSGNYPGSNGIVLRLSGVYEAA